MSTTPHTRERDSELIALLGPPDMQRSDYNIRWWTEEHILAAMRRISTPLTLSDEMVEAVARAIMGARINMAPADMADYINENWCTFADEAEAAIQAALNLMGGKK